MRAQARRPAPATSSPGRTGSERRSAPVPRATAIPMATRATRKRIRSIVVKVSHALRLPAPVGSFTTLNQLTADMKISNAKPLPAATISPKLILDVSTAAFHAAIPARRRHSTLVGAEATKFGPVPYPQPRAARRVHRDSHAQGTSISVDLLRRGGRDVGTHAIERRRWRRDQGGRARGGGGVPLHGPRRSPPRLPARPPHRPGRQPP